MKILKTEIEGNTLLAVQFTGESSPPHRWLRKLAYFF
jgi:hypothetical protein